MDRDNPGVVETWVWPEANAVCPGEVRYPTLLLGGYLIFTMFTVIFLLVKEGARAPVRGHFPVPADYSARVFSAAFMLFYGFVVFTYKADKSSG
jgi:hypothetical protein